MGKVIVIAEHNNKEVKKTTLPCIKAGLEAAKADGSEVVIVATGNNLKNVAETLSRYGASRILTVENTLLENYTAEVNLPVLEEIIKKESPSLVLAPATTFGKDLLPTIAVKFDSGMASDIVGFKIEDGKVKGFLRPMWAGSLIAEVVVEGNPVFATVRTTAFEQAQDTGAVSALESLAINLNGTRIKSKFVELIESVSARPELTDASVVVSGGRGVKGADGFKLVEDLADILGAAVGASRAAVDSGWVSNDFQVGQTGKIVAPSLYIAVGISGAIQHLAGMKDSKVIVAINRDPEAPIFQVADYGLVADFSKAVPELIEEIKKNR